MPDEKFCKLEFCARCGETHIDLMFKKLTRPVYDDNELPLYSHWAPCPTNQEPILMIIMEPK